MVQIPTLKDFFYRNKIRNLWNEFDVEENKWVRSSLKVIKNQMIKKGGSVFFTYYPNTNYLSFEDERHKIWLKFIKFVKENDNIDITDPFPFFVKNASNISMVRSLTDKHPNCEAHKLMADYTFNNLKNIFVPSYIKIPSN